MEAEPPFDSATHLVAHLIREIESSIRAALEPYKERSEETLEGLKQKARALLEKAGIPEGDPIAAAWLKFVGTLEPRHKDDIRAILKGLEIPETDPVATTWLNLAGTIQSFAHRDNLAPPRPLDDEFRLFWGQINEILQVVLDKLESRYLKSLTFLDDLLAKKSPTRDDAKKLQLNVPNNPAIYGYFFHRLSNPAWLKPLRAQKLFADPSEPIFEQTDRGTTKSRRTPSTRHLIRKSD